MKPSPKPLEPSWIGGDKSEWRAECSGVLYEAWCLLPDRSCRGRYLAELSSMTDMVLSSSFA